MNSPAAGSSFSGPTYTPAQMQKYFKRIALPQEWLGHPICTEQRAPGTLSHPKALEFLGVLQGCQISAVPFENLLLHYSSHRSIKIDPESVFDKIIEADSGRGGYCMENNMLFLVVLRTLGFSATPTGGRVNTAATDPANRKNERKYLGWNHMVNIVSVAGGRYLVDVGFGTNGVHHPVRLYPSSSSESEKSCKAQLHRVRRGPMPELLTIPHQEVYIYEFSIQPLSTAPEDIDWVPGYCFTDTEFTVADFQVMNFYTSTNPASFFTNSIVCVRILLKNGHLVGDISMFDDVVKYRQLENGNLVIAKKIDLKSEKERLEVFREMGIKLTKEERNSVRGSAVELMSPLQKMRSLSYEV